MERKTAKVWGVGSVPVCMSMNFSECIRMAESTDMDEKAQITPAY